MPDEVNTTNGRQGPEDLDVTIASAESPSTTAATPIVPSTVGRYRIIRLLGEGGMGAVYEAEQDQPRRRVALKVIKAAWAGPDLLRLATFFRHGDHPWQTFGRLRQCASFERPPAPRSDD